MTPKKPPPHNPQKRRSGFATSQRPSRAEPEASAEGDRKTALIGCGGRSSAHIDAYQHIPGAELTACYAPSPQRREPLAAKYGIRAYDDVEKMIRAEKPDMVHIVTPPDVRVQIMTLVSDLGVPLCTVEKPVAIAVRDWFALRELEARSSTKFAVCHQFRWQPHLMKCQEAAAASITGLRFLDISAGLNIANQGTHSLNYGRSLIGDPRVLRVFGTVGALDQRDVRHVSPDSSAAMLTFDNGIRGMWTSGGVSPRVGDPEVDWQHVRVSAYGPQDWVNYEEFGRWDIVVADRTDGGDWGGPDEWRRNNDLAQAGFHQAMFDWLEDDTKPPGTNLEISLHEWKTVLALYESALTRRPVELEDFEPDEGLVDRLFR